MPSAFWRVPLSDLADLDLTISGKGEGHCAISWKAQWSLAGGDNHRACSTTSVRADFLEEGSDRCTTGYVPSCPRYGELPLREMNPPEAQATRLHCSVVELSLRPPTFCHAAHKRHVRGGESRSYRKEAGSSSARPGNTKHHSDPETVPWSTLQAPTNSSGKPARKTKVEHTTGRRL